MEDSVQHTIAPIRVPGEAVRPHQRSGSLQLPVNNVLLDMLKHLLVVYIDDILIFSKSLEDHVQHFRAVLLRLLEHLLFVKAEKCEFHSSLVSFLGYMFSPGSIQMNPAKISAVLNWPVPNSKKQLQWFLGCQFLPALN